jgi:transcriptional regulator with XRE-family HTH domain
VARPQSQASGKTGSAELAQVIRDRRLQLGISRQELADATDIPYSTLAQVETAYRGVSPSRLGVIARALQLDPKELYDVLAREPSLTSAAPSPDLAAGAPEEGTAWHPNPAYAAAPSPAFAVDALAMVTGERSGPDVVDEVVELLSELPADHRIDALGQVQRRLLSGLVQEGIWRAASHRPDRG